MKYNLLFLLILLLCACGSSSKVVSDENKTELPVLSQNLPIPDNRSLDTYQVLIIGNSHVRSIEELLTIIFQQGLKENEVSLDTRRLSFLDVVVNIDSLIDLVEKALWTHVILQGQKYSQSQLMFYSTDATKNWIQLVKSIGATPILFPEHPQRGNTQEAEYVHNIHLGIANQEPSCVAPIGLTWDEVLLVEPELDLYQSDGNHATELGALLSSLVLYQVISGQAADQLPFIADLPGTESIQALLGQFASQVVAENDACDF